MSSKARAPWRAVFLLFLGVFFAAAAGAVSLTGSPEVLRICDGSGVGQLTLSWDASDANAQFVEVHVGTPDGPLFANGQAVGSAVTGKWVTKETSFLLVNSATKEVLALYVPRIAGDGCAAAEAPKGFWRRILGWFGL